MRQGPNLADLAPCFKTSPSQQGIGKYGVELRDISGPHIELDAVVGLWTARDWESFTLTVNGNMSESFNRAKYFPTRLRSSTRMISFVLSKTLRGSACWKRNK